MCSIFVYLDTYDVITGVGVFVPNHITEESFDELHRILKPGRNLKLEKKDPILN